MTVALCLAAGLVWAWLWHVASGSASGELAFPLFRAEGRTQDGIARRGPPAPHDDRLVFLGLDQPNYGDLYSEEEAAEEPALALMAKDYPWSREVWGRLVDRLADAGARAVVFDLMFVSPGRGDAEFAAALARHPDRVVLGANLNDSLDVILWPSDSLMDGVGAADAGMVGIVNFFPDPDNVIRRTLYQFPLLTGRKPSLVAQGLAQADFPVEGDAPWSRAGFQRFRFAGPAGTYAHRPVYEIFVPSLWRRNYGDGAFFKDKIVVVGPAANWTQDMHETEQGRMFGAEVHIHAMGAALQNAFIREATPLQAWLLILGAAAVAAVLMSLWENPWLRFGAMVGVSAGGFGLAQLAYNATGWMPVVVAPVLAFNFGCGLCLVHKFFVTVMEKLRMRSMLERYVSQNFVREILDQTDSFEESLGGVRKQCVMLFSDIRGFTTMTEGADSQALVTQLNEYLGEMVECVFKRQGTLDKFIGDAVMAVWGNVRARTPREDAVDAVHCALEMLAGLARLNPAWAASGRAEWHIGIGINYGEVIVGNMGSPRRKEFTVIGDSVNLASRLEGVTKEYGLALAVGEDAAALVRDDFTLQAVDLIRVKGKKRPVEVFTVIAPAVETLSEALRRALDVYAEGMSAYRAGRFAEARTKFEESARASSHNRLASIYVERCGALMENPPGPEWDGVYVMRTK